MTPPTLLTKRYACDMQRSASALAEGHARAREPRLCEVPLSPHRGEQKPHATTANSMR